MGVSMNVRAPSRSAFSIGSNQLSKSSPSTEQAAAFMLSFVMAWSPVRRSNAGIRWVETPGDYATLNSNHSRDATDLRCSTLSYSVRFYVRGLDYLGPLVDFVGMRRRTAVNISTTQ